MVGIGAGPNAARFFESVANQAVGTAPGDHSGRLIGEMLGRVDYLVLQSDLMPHVFAVLNFADLPRAVGHSTSNLQCRV